MLVFLFPGIHGAGKNAILISSRMYFLLRATGECYNEK